MTEQRPQTEAELIASLRASDVRAPQELHRKVEALIAARSPRAPHRRRAPFGAFGAGRNGVATGLAGAIALAAVATVAIAVGLTAGAGSELSVRQASTLTLRPATLPAPAESPGHNGQLLASVEGVPFPYWEERFGWRSTGARTDHIDGRTITTVFYANGRGGRLGYAIVAGAPAPRISGGTVAWRAGVPYRLLMQNGAQTIVWLRNGHLCVVSGSGVDSATLLRLASWGERGSVPA